MSDTEDKTAFPLTRNQIYYARHREEKRKKVLERYHANPVVLAQRAERERILAEKKARREAEKEEERQRKQYERQKQMEERNQKRLALIEEKKKGVSIRSSSQNHTIHE